MPNMDFYEVDPLDEPSVDSPKEEGGGDKQEKEDYEHAFHMGIAAGSASAFSEYLATKPEIEAVYKQVTGR